LCMTNRQYCFALLRLRLLIDEWSKYEKNGRSKLKGCCELSGGQRLESFVYLVYVYFVHMAYVQTLCRFHSGKFPLVSWATTPCLDSHEQTFKPVYRQASFLW
jgi:hypothetical protein